MTKTLASLIALTLMSATTVTATASDAPTPTFDVTIQYDATAPVEEIYASLKKRSRTLCKRQVRTVETMSIRNDYLKSCTSELVASAVKRIEMTALTQYYAQKMNRTVTQQFAQMAR